MNNKDRFLVRNTKIADFEMIRDLCREVYPTSEPWSFEQLESHFRIFPEGQFVVIDQKDGRVVGFAASLIVDWNEYNMESDWRDFTDGGMFTNHDPANGRTLYGAEIMVSPSLRGLGIGKALYAARKALVRRLNLVRIRAGARLRGYHKYIGKMKNAEEYVMAVIQGKIVDPTLTFQLKQGFHVLGVASRYLRHDPESMGYAAVIEWINPDAAKEHHFKDLEKSKFYLPSEVKKGGH